MKHIGRNPWLFNGWSTVRTATSQQQPDLMPPSPCLQDGLAAATSDEVHNTRDREYGVQARRRGCMNYLQHQGQHKPLIGPDEGQDHKQPGKSGGWSCHASSSAVVVPAGHGAHQQQQPSSM